MIVAVLVRVKAPAGMTQQQVACEVKSSIGFGQPETQILYVEDDDSDPAE